MIRIRVRMPRKNLSASKDKRAVRLWMDQIATNSEKVFRKGMMKGPHTGEHWDRLPRRSSINLPRKQYPANQFGKLIQTIKSRVGSDTVRIQSGGATARYAVYLRHGWKVPSTGKRVHARKMSPDALRTGIRATKSPRFARFQKGKSGVIQ